MAVTEWQTQLARALGRPDGKAAGRFASSVPPTYLDRVAPDQAARDLVELERLVETVPRVEDGSDDVAARFGGHHRLTVGADAGAEPGTFRLRRYGLGAVELSSLLPALESFGLVVVEAVPTRIEASHGQPPVYIDDVGIRLVDATVAFDVHDLDDAGRLVEALEALALGEIEIDSLNRLVVAAGLSWPQVRILRAYRRYRHQTGIPLSDADLDDPLVEFPLVAAGLVRYFEARLDPWTSCPDAVAGRRAQVLEALEAVVHRDQDRVLRAYLALVEATLRTTYFLRTPTGRPHTTLTVKLDSRSVPDLPKPRPLIETFVHGAGVEGIHLRFGRVARGGIRWSDRPDDFRTEILGLAEAQVKKNAIIVPTGAKGGFVCRRGGPPSAADVRAAYVTFIGALLDITDDLVDGRVVTPAGVMALDDEDPYLVVAADRGTATYSDLANALAAEHGFWLGDAFASGGSHGYDHKAMGITARGAWVAVRRHFHQLGIDVQSEAVRVAGIGDMSGDVFGNGMLQSRVIELVAAFDHRHVFLDPSPDPARSFGERQRLAGLGPSSWDDYDRSAISAGGGVWSRDVKSVPLSPAARAALGVTAEELSPPALISAILAAPVDLLWFGGIGTYVKAPDEADADVGDHANDEVRVVADQVRARVIAEGGNLGVTNRARIRYSRRGGRINADFIDNAAGVATSDREVNLKILLALAAERGRLLAEERDGVLRAVEDHVAVEVLRQVDHSVSALNRAVPASAPELDAYEALLVDLEGSDRIDRAVEALPPAEEWQRRREAGAGLIRPELAVLLAAAKSDLLDALVASDLADDISLRDVVGPYFPPLIRDRFGDLIPEHRLYPELLATDLAGEIIDQMGVVWAHETAAELDVSLAEVAGAFWVARQLLGADELWRVGEATGAELSADAEAVLHASVAAAVGGLARRYLLAGPGRPAARIAADGRYAAELRGQPDGPTPVSDQLEGAGVPAALARRAGARIGAVAVADVADVARRSGRTVSEVAEAWTLVRDAAGADLLARAVGAVPVSGRWATWQAHALLDDTTSWCASATAAALETADGDVRAWLTARRPALQRARGLLDHLVAGSGDELAVGSLFVRALPRHA